MYIAEITIAVLIGLLVIISAIYLTYFLVNHYKIDKARFESGEEIEEKSTKKKVLEIGLYVYFALSLFIFITNVVYRASPVINGSHCVSIKTDSMAQAISSNTYLKANNLTNQIAQYDIAIFNETKKEDIKQYDIILFKKDNILIAHRIVEINSDGNYVTQGDKNPVKDDFVVEYSEVIGKYNHSLKFMSFINYIGYTPGFYIAMVGVTYDIAVILFFEAKENKLKKS